MIDIILEALLSGWEALVDYVTNHTVTCLIPALFIAGAIAAFVKKEAVLKYLGPRVGRYISYPIAATSGVVLAVCSCTILPLFAGIYKKGSGIGPATAFLYSGPAINVLAIFYTGSALGYDLGAARAFGAILMSMVIGAYMSILFRKHDRKLVRDAIRNPTPPQQSEERKKKWVVPALLGILLGILIFAASSLAWTVKGPIVAVLILLLGFLLWKLFRSEDLRDWWDETWDLSKKIVPILVIGAFVVGIIAYFLPPETFAPIVGGESIISNLTASVIGALLYMPTLLEVPIIGTTFGYLDGQMGAGPALSLLLAGPAVSLPNMVVLYKIMGPKKTGAYIVMVVIISTMAGHVYGNLIA
jgi:hypothetical protein